MAARGISLVSSGASVDSSMILALADTISGITGISSGILTVGLTGSATVSSGILTVDTAAEADFSWTRD